MRQTNLYSSPSTNRAGRLSGVLLFLACALTSVSAWAQIHTAATDQAPAAVNLRDTPMAHSRTPLEVVSGTAKLVGRFDAQSKLRLTLGLNPPKLAEEEKFLAELQDKSSPNFHKYLTPAQWNARFAPSAQDEQAIVDWLTANGMTVTHRYPNRLVVDAEGASQVIEKAFAVQVNSYKVGAEVEFSNDRDPVIPAHLAGILHSVGGLNSIQRTHAPHEGSISQQSAQYSAGSVVSSQAGEHGDGKTTALEAAMKASEAKLGASNVMKGLASGSNPEPGVTNGYIDPTDIYSSYGYDFSALQAQGHCCNPTNDSGGSTPTTSIAIATAGDFASSDITGFQSQYPYLAYFYNRVFIDGTPSCCNDETTLDTEWAIATANSFGSYLQTSHIWVYEGANNYLSTFTDVYNQMLSDGHARIFTTSWGCAELTCASSGTMDTDHAIFNSMLGQGWTILALSHDHGATGGCDDALRVTYPGSDPDAVSVGGTSLALYSDGTFASETAWEGSHSAGSCSNNGGGSGGGCSAYYAAPGYQSSPYCGAGSRSVPDISLNAGYGQNYYFNGGLHGVGGTSISTPQVAGFMAQENSYLMSIGVGCGTNYLSNCAPMGQADYAMYREGYAESSGGSYAPHNPYYDIKVGCNSNDITDLYGLGYYCAGTGYDAITGWGSFNALQLSWAINTYYTGDFAAPKITFSGPAVSTTAYTWFNTNQTVSWTVVDQNNGTYPSVGVAGFSQAWDSAFSDPTTEAHQGTGNSFYSGPQFPKATSGYLNLSSAGQGCHYATVDAWDNTGFSTGNEYYYWLCYDTVAPTVTPANAPGPNTHGWNKQTVKVSLASTDPGGSNASGLVATYYSIDTTACSSSTLGSCSVYSSPFSITTSGYHYVAYFAKDKAGNFSARNYDYVYIDETAPVTTATLSGTLSGTVYDTAVHVTLAATDNLSGVISTSYQLDGGAVTAYSAPFAVSTLGSHSVKFYSVDYAGNTETTKTVSFSISAATTTTLTASPNPGLNGQTIALTATVAANLGATPTGTVTFKRGTAVLGTGTISGGAAHLSLTSLPFGSSTLTASYPGATNILASTSAGVVEVYKQKTTTALTSSLNPSTAGVSVTFTATVTAAVSGTPTGSVQFYSGATLLSTKTLSSGTATYSTTALPVGTDLIKAVYEGSGTDASSTSPTVSQSVKKAATTTTLAASVNPSSFGQPVTFTATVTSGSGIPTGTVTFQKNGATLGTGTLSGTGKATLTTAVLVPGTHTITAIYAGSTNYTGSTSAAVSEVTNASATTTKVTSSLNPSTRGQSVTFTATVSAGAYGTPTGSVTFKNGAGILGIVSLSGGTATLSTAALAGGTNSITVVYSGSSEYLTSTSAAFAQTVNRSATTTTLTSSLNPSTHGTSVTFTATVTAASGPTPTGSVAFKDGTAALGSVAVNAAGVATFSTSSLAVRTHSITATYVGTTNDSTSTSAVLSQVVN
jgi:subtilase family serine protease